MSQKEQEEEWIFNLFNDNYSRFPDEVVKHKDKPDFWIQNDQLSIGIELTKVFQDSNTSSSGSKLKEGESLHEQIARNVQNLLTEKYPNIPLWIDLHFKTYDIDPSRFQKLVTSIVDAIQRHINAIDLSEKFDHFTISDYRILPKELYDINILFHEKSENTYVYGSGGGWVPNATYDLLASVVSKKDRLIESYRNFSEYWLLIAEGMTFTSYLDQCKELILSDFNTGFSKIFLVRLLNQEVVELK